MLHLGQQVSVHNLSAAVTPRNKSTIRVLAATVSSLRVLDAFRAKPPHLSIVIPIEDPGVLIVLYFVTPRRITSVSTASTVRGAVGRVVFMIGLEHGERLVLRGPSVVGAFGSLDGFGDFFGYCIMQLAQYVVVEDLSSHLGN